MNISAGGKAYKMIAGRIGAQPGLLPPGRTVTFQLRLLRITARSSSFINPGIICVTVHDMKTTHNIYFADSRAMSALENETIDLVVTSPPYPMIEMWDSVFAAMNNEIGSALDAQDGRAAFSLMHAELLPVWCEIARVLKNGGIACVNIGDATRKIGDAFRLYSNHARIATAFFELGLDPLPVILWRKQTNSPNKFMGSGMLPSGAYVTLEHEYILIFRKGGKRIFAGDEHKRNRRRSACFWEERNIWYSDTWDFKGTRQTFTSTQARKRSAAYPRELAYRLICMYSAYGDTVLDPFLGTGTTMLAAAAAGRNSKGYEIDEQLKTAIEGAMNTVTAYSCGKAEQRLQNHLSFVEEYSARKGRPAHTNTTYGFPVVTSQETDLELYEACDISRPDVSEYTVDYKPSTVEP